MRQSTIGKVGVTLAVCGNEFSVDHEDVLRIAEFNWTLTKQGYAITSGGNKVIYLHRLIMDAPIGKCVDHINGDRTDNRKSNLRICTQAQNLYNSTAQSTSTSKFKGVSWKSDKRKWRASIKINGKCFHLGYFNDEVSAAKVYNERAIKEFGEYAYLNTVL